MFISEDSFWNLPVQRPDAWYQALQLLQVSVVLANLAKHFLKS
jgi:hypothetical protein